MGREGVARGSVGNGREKLPTQWRCFISRNQVFFVFRLSGVGNKWKDIYKVVDDMMKWCTNYGWCFVLLGGVHPLDSGGKGAPRVRSAEPRVVT